MIMKILTFDQSRCTNCGICRIVRSLVKKGEFRPEASRIRIELSDLADNVPAGQNPALRAVVCQHCAKPACVTACMRGIIHKDPATGVVLRNWEDCFRCAACQVMCPVGAPLEDGEMKAFVTCDLCTAERESGGLPGEEPLCSALCPTGALRYEDVQAASAALREQYARRMLTALPDPFGDGDKAAETEAAQQGLPEPDWKAVSKEIEKALGIKAGVRSLKAWSRKLRKEAEEEVR